MYLNIGTGYPWALQVTAREDVSAPRTTKLPTSEGKAGALVLTGSTFTK